MLGKLSNTQKVIMSGIVILIVVVVILRINVARLRSPFSRFEDAINAGQVTTAVESYKQMTGDKEKTNRSNAEKMAVQYARIRLGEYTSDGAGYDMVSSELYAIEKDILPGNSQIEKFISEMEYWHEAEENYNLGMEVKAEEKYEEAIEILERVPSDYTGYFAAQVAIKECNELKEARAKGALEQAIGMVDINKDIRTYLDAIKVLDDYSKEHPDDNFISARREQFMDEYYNIQLKNIQTLAATGEEENRKAALEIARELKEVNPDRGEADELIGQLSE